MLPTRTRLPEINPRLVDFLIVDEGAVAAVGVATRPSPRMSCDDHACERT